MGHNREIKYIDCCLEPINTGKNKEQQEREDVLVLLLFYLGSETRFTITSREL